MRARNRSTYLMAFSILIKILPLPCPTAKGSIKAAFLAALVYSLNFYWYKSRVKFLNSITTFYNQRERTIYLNNSNKNIFNISLISTCFKLQKNKVTQPRLQKISHQFLTVPKLFMESTGNFYIDLLLEVATVLNGF